MKYTGKSNEEYEYKSVSGAWVKQPKFYCTYHKAYLTDKQAAAHHCWNKHNKGICHRLYTLDRKGVRNTNEKKLQSTLDKILDRLINIDTKTGKLLKQIEKMQNSSKDIDMKRYEDDGK